MVVVAEREREGNAIEREKRVDKNMHSVSTRSVRTLYKERTTGGRLLSLISAFSSKY